MIKEKDEEISKRDTIAIAEKDAKLDSKKVEITSKDLTINSLNSSITQLQ